MLCLGFDTWNYSDPFTSWILLRLCQKKALAGDWKTRGWGGASFFLFGWCSVSIVPPVAASRSSGGTLSHTSCFSQWVASSKRWEPASSCPFRDLNLNSERSHWELLGSDKPNLLPSFLWHAEWQHPLAGIISHCSSFPVLKAPLKAQWDFSFPDWERDTAAFKSVRLGVQHGKLRTSNKESKLGVNTVDIIDERPIKLLSWIWSAIEKWGGGANQR